MYDRNWQPTASHESLIQRAKILKKIRLFFESRNILEVDTPLLGKTATPDPLIQPFITSYQGPAYPTGINLYLQTSPEFAMKRLLANGTGAIYQICKAFRNGEFGVNHNPEFTMLEWYRPGFTANELIVETSELLSEILGTPKAKTITYAEIFQQKLLINPHVVQFSTLEELALEHKIIDQPKALDIDKNGWLDLLFSEIIQPALGFDAPVVITDYPASMAALAKLHQDDNQTTVAQRFEFFVNGKELANGYHELTDPNIQSKRFDADLKQRKSLGHHVMPKDSKLIQALEYGLPECSGIALGIDRLVMLALEKNKLKETLSFDLESI